MGLFGKPKTPAPPKVADREPSRPAQPNGVTASEPPAAVTVVAREGTVEGRLAGKAGIRVEGRVVGEIESDATVEVAGGGTVRGDVHGRVVTIAGAVEGDVSAAERVDLAATGRLTGNITAPRVHIAEGATFEGQVFMRSRPAASAKAPAGEGTGSGTDAAPPPGRRGGRKSGRRS